MLLHLDGSRHRWFQDDRWYDLIVILDDATSQVYYAQLVEEESTRTVRAALREGVALHGAGGSAGTCLPARERAEPGPDLLDPAGAGGGAGQHGEVGGANLADREDAVARDAGGVSSADRGASGWSSDPQLRTARGGPLHGAGGAPHRAAEDLPGEAARRPLGANLSRPTGSLG